MTLRGTVAALLGVAGLVAGCDASAPAAPVAGSGSSRASAAPSVSSATRTPAVRPGSLLSQDPRLLPPQPIVGVDPSASGSSVAGVGVPVRLRIPSIGVDATVMRLGRDASGAMQTPPEWQVPGWYADGPRPGQVGPAVIVGHVDSVGGPAVFFRLPELRIGDRVYV
ncbi:MAG: sortase domain-containing protein, partial [Jatrophihabitans sp.]|uniref:sortase domain-containing protein n=1 Tax=Jatrophihabitans sp. TaxID=1932789 RepID=UPI003F802CD2